MRRGTLIFSLLLFITAPSGGLFAGKIEKGFEALAEYDYFKAKKIFTQVNSKRYDAVACYGLATIFIRNDNPFYNTDSAARYLNLSYHHYLLKREPFRTGNFLVDSTSILDLADSVSFKNMLRAKKLNTVAACDHFLRTNYLGKKRYIYEIVYLRDELEFNLVMDIYKSDTTRQFIVTHPQSIFLREANILLDRQLFDENTRAGSAASYIAFLKKYPRNHMVNTAYDKLFNMYRQQKNVKGLKDFVLSYPKAPQNLEAWKLLFSLVVKTYSYNELKKFIDDYPGFPLKNSILKELELNKLVLFPVEKNELIGYADEKGKFLIRPQFHEATDFSEGLAVVAKNDSVYFINKENNNPFSKTFTEAYTFKNGIAAVKQNQKWNFINRQGQPFSKTYDEISELSDGIYVVKSGERFGAVDQYGQTIIEPQFEKLGDFKNDLAYYLENGLYGFVSRSGSVHKAEYEWISDFDEQHVALIRSKNKYGLVNAAGKKLLETEYDQVIRTNNNVFIIVKENLYGFFSAEGCFISAIAFDYAREKPPGYYSDGNFFRLLKKKEQGMMDANGKMVFNFGAYEDFGFLSDGLIRVKQKNKVGFLDKKSDVVIAFKYTEAGDFKDSVSIAILKEKYLLIDRAGTEIYSSDDPITRISRNNYFVENEAGTVVNRRGIVVATEVEEHSLLSGGMVLLTLKSGEIKLINE